MPFFSLNSSEGSGILRTLSECSIPPVSVVDVSSVSSGSGILMDESVVDYFLEDYDYNNDTEDYDYDNDTLPEVIDHDFVDLLETLNVTLFNWDKFVDFSVTTGDKILSYKWILFILSIPLF